jgi:hypothetical protein
MKVRYTNTASVVDAWLADAEEKLDAADRKIVGVDVENDKTRGSYFSPKKSAIIQICIGNDVLVYHICHADEPSQKLFQLFSGLPPIFLLFRFNT